MDFKNYKQEMNKIIKEDEFGLPELVINESNQPYLLHKLYRS